MQTVTVLCFDHGEVGKVFGLGLSLSVPDSDQDEMLMLS